MKYDSERSKSWLSLAERIAGVAAVACLQVVGVMTDTVLHHVVHALPIVVLLPLRRTRVVRLTAALLGFMWILMLAGVTDELHKSLIRGDLFVSPRTPITWLVPIMVAISATWAALNLSLLRPTRRGLSWFVLGGLMLALALALVHPLLNAAFEVPLDRTDQGEYVWAFVLALELCVLALGPWWLAVRLTGSRHVAITRSAVLRQVAFWGFFLVCMVVGVIPALNPSNQKEYSYYEQGKYKEAIELFSNVVEGKAERESDIDDHLFYYLSLHRAGQAEKANKHIQEFLSKLEVDEWIAPVVHFYAGQLTEEAVLKSAEHRDEQKDNEQKYEAYYYIATKYLLKNDSTKAKEYFEKCIATYVKGAKRFTDWYYNMAEIELARIESKGEITTRK